MVTLLVVEMAGQLVDSSDWWVGRSVEKWAVSSAAWLVDWLVVARVDLWVALLADLLVVV